ncbi:hypothetical protein AGMMS50276_31480 [Synergistales bacterium]|nr:hypothetical protein AGMMS50276_31480 [Synergistales bacterium]
MSKVTDSNYLKFGRRLRKSYRHNLRVLKRFELDNHERRDMALGIAAQIEIERGNFRERDFDEILDLSKDIVFEPFNLDLDFDSPEVFQWR